MDRKSVLTDSSRMMTGCGRVGQNRLLDRVELHTTGCVWFDPVFSTLCVILGENPYPYPVKPVPLNTGTGFLGYGYG